MTDSITDGITDGITDPPLLRTAPAGHYIGGQWVTSATTGVSRSPATGEVLGSYYEAAESQVRQAIHTAREAFAASEWRSNRELRARVLGEMADRVEAATDDLALLLARENGKILPEAHFELSLTPSKLRYYAAQALTDTSRGGRVRPASTRSCSPNPSAWPVSSFPGTRRSCSRSGRSRRRWPRAARS